MLLAILLLPVFGVLLRGKARERLLAQGPLAPEAAGADGVAEALAAARAVNIVAVRLRATCLTRSLVLQWILARRGIATALRIGVHKDAGALQAHAWLECGGTPVNDTVQGTRGFAPLDLQGRLP